MQEYLLYALLGLGPGAVIATMGLGIVQIHRGSAVVNFAQGAMAMYVAYVYYDLYNNGDYLLPIPGLVERVHVGDVGMATSLALSVATAAVLGLLSHFLVFRPLKGAPPLAKVAATIGIMLVLQAIVVLRYGTNTIAVAPVLPDDTHSFELFDSRVPLNRLYLAGIVLAVTLILAYVSRATQFGRSTRASSENEKGAALLGYSPDFLAATNWVIGTVLAGLGGIVVAPIINLNPVTYPLLVVPALAAALMGRFSSFAATAGAALGIGLLQSLTMKFTIDHSWFPQVGAQETVPFVAIILLMFFLGRAMPGRSTLLESDLPFAPRPKHVGVTAILTVTAVLIALNVFSAGYRLALINSLIGSLLCLSIVVITGFVGQISLAQVALAGIAGFTLQNFTNDLGLAFPIAPLMSALVATAVGLLVAIPALRIRGINLAVITFAAAVAVEAFYFRNPNYTGGYEAEPIPSPELFGLDLGITGSSYLRWGLVSPPPMRSMRSR